MTAYTIFKEYLCILLTGIHQYAGVSLRVAHLCISLGIIRSYGRRHTSTERDRSFG